MSLATLKQATQAPLKQTIDFTTPNPLATPNYSLPLYQWCDYEPQYRCWSIGRVGGFFKFNLKLEKKQGVNLIFQLCSSAVNGTTNCPINITVNGKLVVSGFDPHITNFYDMVWPISAEMMEAGDNEIVMTLSGGYSKVFMRYAIVDMYQVSTDEKNWLGSLPDMKVLSEINLPGTHDSAAINTTIHTPYACHDRTITQQLEGGIRALDVRLKVKKDGGNYSFVTCHGAIGSSSGVNEYQSFPSLLDECKAFLAGSSKEVVVMSLKVDDWNGYGNDQQAVLDALATLLSGYPTATSKDLPTLGSVRGKIFLYNRINDELRFGTPVSWTDNTTGAYANHSANRSYNIYVQDQYKGLPVLGANQAKLDDVTAAIGKKQANEVVLNFASATWYGVIGVYIMGDLLGHFGQTDAAGRPATFGWTMFDYPFEKYNTDKYGWIDIVHFVIASNAGYSGFEKPFKIIGHDEL